jgi:hypothetical protein
VRGDAGLRQRLRLFRDFAAQRGSLILAVQDIEIDSSDDVNIVYKDLLTSLQADTKKEDIILRLKFRRFEVFHVPWETCIAERARVHAPEMCYKVVC